VADLVGAEVTAEEETDDHLETGPVLQEGPVHAPDLGTVDLTRMIVEVIPETGVRSHIKIRVFG